MPQAAFPREFNPTRSTRGLTRALGETAMLRIAEAYFRRLLFETGSLQAVSTLSSCWAPRARSGAPQFGLALPEYNVTLCMTYSGEVGNGGHLQYFLNRGGWAARETLGALGSVGLPHAQVILREACNRFPDCFVPDQPDEVESLLDRLPDVFGMSFQALDATLLKERFDETLMTYMQHHAEEILRPERSMVL